MPLVSASADVFLITSLVLICPSIYYSRKSDPPGSNSPPLRKYLNVLVLLHTLFILYKLLLSPPPNIFASFGIPLTATTEKVRDVLLRYARLEASDSTALVSGKGRASLPPNLEDLLTKLSSLDARTLYVRFGHTVLETCNYCNTSFEWALHALPRPLLSYIVETTAVGLVTIRGSHRERWRGWGIGLLVLAALVEAYWVLTAEITIGFSGRNVIMLHDIFWTMRHILFLILPPLLHILPPHVVPPSPLRTLTLLSNTLDRALVRVHLLKYLHGSIMRVPATREAMVDWWETEEREGRWVREDEGVRSLAERAGLGFAGEEGEGEVEVEQAVVLKKTARMAVRALLNGIEDAPREPDENVDIRDTS